MRSRNRSSSWVAHPWPASTAIDINSWPPRNAAVPFDWSMPTHLFYASSVAALAGGGGGGEEEATTKKNDVPGKKDKSTTANTISVDAVHLDHFLSLPSSTVTTATTAHCAPVSAKGLSFSTPFADARRRLDYTYHTHVFLNRQVLQDAIMRRVLIGGESGVDIHRTVQPQPPDDEVTIRRPDIGMALPHKQRRRRPWIIFTAGAMGVGKGYVLMQLQKASLLSALRDDDDKNKNSNDDNEDSLASSSFSPSLFIPIDPDRIKAELPEMAGYLAANRATAATHLHRESTHMADVLLEHVLFTAAAAATKDTNYSNSKTSTTNTLRRNVLIDGSLRDVQYYTALLRRIRAIPNTNTHGNNNTNGTDNDNQSSSAQQRLYRIAILHIVADATVILDRAHARGQRTGRVVPVDVIQQSIDQVPRSVAALTPLVDVVHTIANNEGRPLQLVSTFYNTNDCDDDDNDNVLVHDNNGCLDESIRKSVPKTVQNPSWEEFARSWEESHDDAAVESEPCDSTSTGALSPPPTRLLCLPIVDMAGVVYCSKSHAVANRIWKSSYPNVCARCAIASDDEPCGICVHNCHICACEICDHGASFAFCKTTVMPS